MKERFPSWSLALYMFHTLGKQHIPLWPTQLDPLTNGSLRRRLITEESSEAVDAIVNMEPVEDQAKELIDVIFVALGGLIDMGLFEVVPDLFEEVRRSNMSKMQGGTILDGGKVKKGPGYKPANLKSIIEKHYYGREDTKQT